MEDTVSKHERVTARGEDEEMRNHSRLPPWEKTTPTTGEGVSCDAHEISYTYTLRSTGGEGKICASSG